MATKFSDYIHESKGDAINEKFKDALATIKHFNLNNGDSKLLGKAVEQVFGAKDMATLQGSMLQQLQGAIEGLASSLGITEQTPQEVAGEPTELSGEPQAETPEHEAEESPAEEAAEHAEGGSEEGTEAVEGEELPPTSASEVKESYTVRMANYFCENFQ